MRKERQTSKEQKLSEQVSRMLDLLNTKENNLPIGVLVKLNIDHNFIEDLPDPNTNGVHMNADMSEEPNTPAAVLTINSDKLHLSLGIYINKDGEWLANVGGQYWQTVVYSEEVMKQKNTMQELFGDPNLQKKRISILRGNKTKAIPIQPFNLFLSIDLGKTVLNIVNSVLEETENSQYRNYTIQTVAGTHKYDGFYIWDRE